MNWTRGWPKKQQPRAIYIWGLSLKLQKESNAEILASPDSRRISKG